MKNILYICTMKVNKEIRIRGLVQGVGFRPFIYRVAQEMGILGEVENRTDGVIILAELSDEDCERFIQRIREEHPVVASVFSIEMVPAVSKNYTSFSIIPGKGKSDVVTQVAPDIAVCLDCLRDRITQKHRLDYPFINCTHCGPRFSIIQDLPYDRERTTMSGFTMCPDCRQEYTDVDDRRFHAQPLACNHCGPSYYISANRTGERGYATLLDSVLRLIREGEVIAVKGIGGYNLVCDAMNKKAVKRLREVKERDSKPFALMFRDLETLRQYTFVDETEAECLTSWRRPIVLLKQRKPLAEGINPGMQTLGCMLPYMPIHYDWFEQLKMPALVMTSGNISDLPIAISEEEAEEQFGGKVALILHHNRPIHNRVDDSVLQVCEGQPCLIRRSRGYVPEPFFSHTSVEGVLAFGAEQVNTFALGKGDTIIQSQYIGDLKNWETFRFYTESMERFQRLFRFTPRRLVCDLHPDYLSSREAERMAEELRLPLQRVQHHHAHALACMAEYRLEEPVIAIVMDGTGLGDDGHIWGGEFFLCDRHGYQRLAHLEYLPLPGGDKAVLEPWRMAVSCLHHWNLPIPESLIQRVGEEPITRICQMIDRQINTPLTSSAGRLFDAIASLTGICDVSSRQAEAPILLEQAISEGDFLPYPFSRYNDCRDAVRHASTTSNYYSRDISLRPVFEAILQDLEEGVPSGIISARFHTTLAHLLTIKARQLLTQTEATKVVISGGCFQNKNLTTSLQHLFASENIPLYIPSRIPCNDSGIAVGQIFFTTFATVVKKV